MLSPSDLPNIGTELHILILLHWQVGSLSLASPFGSLDANTKGWTVQHTYQSPGREQHLQNTQWPLDDLSPEP